MEFGRVPEMELMAIDFNLPAEPRWNKAVLSKKGNKDIKIFLGCAKWGRKEWKGKIYPSKISEKEFLDEYVKHYNSIELNATHYKLYSPEQIRIWGDKAKDSNFKFCPKFYNNISHFGSLSNKKFLTDSFLESIEAFGSNLGPAFLQVSDRFTPNRKEELFKYLETLPTDITIFLEVRHPDWYKVPHFNELIAVLNKLNLGIVITDTAGRRDCCHMHLTTTKTFIRYVGNSLHFTDYTRIDEWIQRIKYWKNMGLKELYFFMHMHDETFSPELTVYLVTNLNKHCNLKLQMPLFVNKDHLDIF